MAIAYYVVLSAPEPYGFCTATDGEDGLHCALQTIASAYTKRPSESVWMVPGTY
jgi:hypothetical protein